MNHTITSASPRAHLTGVDDKSTMPQVYEQLNDAQHAPLFLVMTERGNTDINFIDGARFDAIYGASSLLPASEYHTHQTEGLKAALSSGNASIAVKRVVGPNPTKASLEICVIPFGDTSDKDFTVGVESDYTDEDDALAGTPLITFEAANVGEFGNNLSITIVPASAIAQRVKGPAFNGFVYELYIEAVNPKTGVRRLVYTNTRESGTLFTLNPDDGLGNVNPHYLTTVIKEDYKDLTLNTNTDIGNIIVHHDALDALHNSLGKDERIWDYDILGAGGLTMTRDLYRSLTGGSDGFTDQVQGFVSARTHLLEQYDNAVYTYFSEMDDSHPLGDMAKYPVSVFYDTGFSIRTKLSLTSLLGLRQDVSVGLSVYSVAGHYEGLDGEQAFRYSSKMSMDDAISTAIQLRTHFSLYPESEVYGTPAMRAFIVMQSGIYEKTGYAQRQSIIIDLIEKISGYIGSGDKIWKTAKAFDLSPNNELNGWSNVNYTYRPQTADDGAWSAGIIWVENKGTSSLFYPSFQTIYPEDTSIFNNILTMFVCCYLNKVARLTWAQTTGSTGTTDELLIEANNDIIMREVYGKFDERFKIRVETTFSRADKARGYSWATAIHLYANTSKTVATYKITSNRMS